MNSSSDLKDLAAALVKAQMAIVPPTKNQNNPFFKSKYADLSAVIEAVRRPLADNGLSYVQMTDVLDGRMVLRTRLLHSSGQWIEGVYPVDPGDDPKKQNPQGYGSALTYARRYALSALLGIAADEDDDGNAASYPPAPRRKKAFEPPVYTCEGCDLSIVADTPEVEAAIVQVERQYGRVLCRSCRERQDAAKPESVIGHAPELDEVA